MRMYRAQRSAYAILLVLAFILLFLAMLGVAFRQIGAALRIESARIQQLDRDEGCMHALARGLALLETGLPPTSPYVRATTIVTTRGLRSYTLTFASEGGTNWTVSASPTAETDALILLPDTFAPVP